MNRNGISNRAAALSSRAAGWKHGPGIRGALLFLFVLLFYFILEQHLIPRTYDIQLNTVTARDIVAPKQWEDTSATLKAQEQAAENVESKYSIVALRNEGLIDQIFARMERLNAEDQVTFQNKVDIYRREIPDRYDAFVDNFIRNNAGADTYNPTLLQEMAVRVKEQAYQITEETYYKLPLLNANQIAEMRAVAYEVVRKLMAEQLPDAETARTKVAELVNTSALSERTTREIVAELARYAIMPNRFYDKVATEEAKVKAKADTPPVVIKEGDVVARSGQLITPELYERLDGLGLLQDKKNYWPNLGLLTISLLAALALYGYLAQWGIMNGGPNRSYHNAQLLMLWLIFAVNLLTMTVIAMIQTDDIFYIGFLAPAAMGTILIALLLDTHLAMVSSFLFAVFGSVMFNQDNDRIFDFNYGFVIAVVSFTAIFAVHRASQRSTLLKAGIMVSLFGTVAVLALLTFGEPSARTEILLAAGFAFASGLLTAILVIGLMPFFEITFGILSALKLVELSNPNHPLLRKLLTETPGTYHHSVMVGNLSEAAAEAIGANGLLCRVGSFYHDIGKTKRPSYFIENQTAIENPHDSIDPKLSKSIIIAHARDGVDMLKAHNIPKPLRDIAEQHHGTTSLKYFYHKALKEAEAEGAEPDFTEDDFRYPGPKAQSKEAAIVGIADCVEAAVRSLRNPTMEQIENMIHKIIKNRLDDNQFNECDLTMKELDRVAQTLKETVAGIFHSRIEYPEDVKPKERLG
ncbi:7TM receptor with intracellular metal dependent phosphohydrolase [Paenibacillus darwinianus]|uniref:7TM receptor with intracellular metal dependent phosphohydrolase n=1 Tax=Paenibacillus darwinianus TaxID=1380763 RepID=A0A9W5S2R8_9BACL|nr:HDIG domain-containing metalloprotein [Paenibacillus darwinianus]EXX91905.1 7TM receptor with intracellular metal dependent phosphohydrolase [Paenibacillus darwinianus]EXX92316.1 7TM receptor with intracellular metal dependent phosphohydrolase [Paenibacillus darwinianus]EXX92744.1 7TM receptor with intracellular metal dependent phosphohydrolase [Paenibacillus darwinianus]